MKPFDLVRKSNLNLEIIKPNLLHDGKENAFVEEKKIIYFSLF